MNIPLISLIFVVCAFTGLLVWAFHPKNKARFKEYGEIPLNDEDSM